MPYPLQFFQHASESLLQFVSKSSEHHMSGDSQAAETVEDRTEHRGDTRSVHRWPQCGVDGIDAMAAGFPAAIDRTWMCNVRRSGVDSRRSLAPQRCPGSDR
jgi:hypothetical protein